MPYCTECGEKVKKDAKFCTECGNKIKRTSGNDVVIESSSNKSKGEDEFIDQVRSLLKIGLFLGFAAGFLLNLSGSAFLENLVEVGAMGMRYATEEFLIGLIYGLIPGGIAGFIVGGILGIIVSAVAKALRNRPISFISGLFSGFLLIFTIRPLYYWVLGWGIEAIAPAVGVFIGVLLGSYSGFSRGIEFTSG